MLGRQWVLSLQSTQMDVEVEAHPLPPSGQAQQLWVSNRTRSTQMVVEVQAHSPPPGQTLGNHRTFLIEIYKQLWTTVTVYTDKRKTTCTAYHGWPVPDTLLDGPLNWLGQVLWVHPAQSGKYYTVFFKPNCITSVYVLSCFHWIHLNFKECATPPHIHPKSRNITACDQFYQAFPRVSTASDKCWGEKAWVQATHTTITTYCKGRHVHKMVHFGIIWL